MNAALRTDLFLSSAATVGCFATLIAVLGELPASGREAGLAIGRVKTATAGVRSRNDGTLVWYRLDAGDAIYDGDGVFAGDDAQTLIQLGDGSSIEVGENSLVVVQRRAKSEEAAVTLKRGSVTGSSRGSLLVNAGGSQVDLEDGARGTVRVAGNGARVQVAAGTARVGASELGQGSRAMLGGGEARLESTATIELVSPEDGARAVRGRAVTFAWREHPGAGPYTLEIAKDADFAEIVAKTEVAALSVEVKLDPGIVSWRVRRGTGSSLDRRLVVEAPAAPVLYRPRAGEAVYLPDGAAPEIAFAWTPIAGAPRYALEIAREEKTVVLADAEQSVWFHRGRLDEGRHCVRVRAAGGEWSAPSCFEVVGAERLRAPKLMREDGK